MKLAIMKNGRVGDVKRQFSSQYPFLKIEFLVFQRQGEGPAKQIVAGDSRKLSEIRSDMKEGALRVGDSTTVKELEDFFRNHLLDVQVFRRSDNLWLETTMTDEWTLEKQNNHGKEITESKHSPATRRSFDEGLAGNGF